MARQRWGVGAGVLLGRLVLAVAGRADEAAAVKMIEKLGGQVTRDDKRPGRPVVDVDLGGTTVTDAGLKELKELKTLQSLEIGSTQVTYTGMQGVMVLEAL